MKTGDIPSNALDHTTLVWIGEAHHRDRCARRRGLDCDCGKEAIRDALIGRIQSVGNAVATAAETITRRVNAVTDTQLWALVDAINGCHTEECGYNLDPVRAELAEILCDETPAALSSAPQGRVSMVLPDDGDENGWQEFARAFDSRPDAARWLVAALTDPQGRTEDDVVRWFMEHFQGCADSDVPMVNRVLDILTGSDKMREKDWASDVECRAVGDRLEAMFVPAVTPPLPSLRDCVTLSGDNAEETLRRVALLESDDAWLRHQVAGCRAAASESVQPDNVTRDRLLEWADRFERILCRRAALTAPQGRGEVLAEDVAELMKRHARALTDTPEREFLARILTALETLQGRVDYETNRNKFRVAEKSGVTQVVGRGDVSEKPIEREALIRIIDENWYQDGNSQRDAMAKMADAILAALRPAPSSPEQEGK
jgi:hypothetical protein